ncbi:hypothetical protein HHI36_016642 [Cryptolaemus montrouzieri]|uniref:Uncharacterized protein n=1 Tax=Cryptolaemus montrouzieri TaxID=559131 RepID=A0ABD2NKA4_9CUCU
MAQRLRLRMMDLQMNEWTHFLFCNKNSTSTQTLAGVNVGAICSTHEEITVGKKMQNSALGEDSINESNLEGPVDGKGYVKPVFGEPEIVEISARAPQFKKSIVH